ncbi:MAG: hypothetical protein J6Y53_04435 [Alphaproteobacteria bacterium]|nr:hypothetical protein [Alphaproteobacteria bacterium]
MNTCFWGYSSAGLEKEKVDLMSSFYFDRRSFVILQAANGAHSKSYKASDRSELSERI